MQCKTFAEAYAWALKEVMSNPRYISSPRGKEIREILNLSFTVNNVLSNTFENNVRSIPSHYLAGELDWYFSGDNRIENIIEYSNFWDHIKNPDGTLNSAYGHLLFKKKNLAGITQWKWAYDSLIEDKDSRQAIMYFGGPDFQFPGNKDFVCTCLGQFFIRDNKLNFIITMRSNDLIRGMTFDIPFFMLLQQNMWLLLKEKYPDLKLGSYTHNALSAHVYSEHYNLAHDMIYAGFKDSGLPAMTHPVIDKDGNWDRSAQPLNTWIQQNKVK